MNGETKSATGASPRDEVIARAQAMVPELKARAAETEALRRVPGETVEAFREAGFYRILQPEAYGGLALEYGMQTELAIALGPGCASSAWDASLTACHAWILGMFPREAQDEVWAATPEAEVSTCFLAIDSKIEPSSGGIRLSGHWKFSSGVDHCRWAILATRMEGPNGTPEEYLALVPLADCVVEDVWHSTGMAGTGSNDIIVSDQFVPDHRLLRVMDLRGEETPGSKTHGHYIYRLPMHGVFSFNLVGSAIGIARGAMKGVVAGLTARKSVTMAPLTKLQSAQLRVAESGAEIDAAYALMDRNREEINRGGREGRMPDMSQRVRYRRDNAFATQLCVRAVDRIFPLLGGRGMATGDPVQRAWRDIHAVSHHIALTWDLQGPIQGAVALGEPCPDPRV